MIVRNSSELSRMEEVVEMCGILGDSCVLAFSVSAGSGCTAYGTVLNFFRRGMLRKFHDLT